MLQKTLNDSKTVENKDQQINKLRNAITQLLMDTMLEGDTAKVDIEWHSEKDQTEYHIEGNLEKVNPFKELDEKFQKFDKKLFYNIENFFKDRRVNLDIYGDRQSGKTSKAIMTMIKALEGKENYTVLFSAPTTMDNSNVLESIHEWIRVLNINVNTHVVGNFVFLVLNPKFGFSPSRCNQVDLLIIDDAEVRRGVDDHKIIRFYDHNVDTKIIKFHTRGDNESKTLNVKNPFFVLEPNNFGAGFFKQY